MGKGHGTNGSIMGLENCFEIECKAIPQRKLSACGACEHAATFRRPLQWLRWAPYDLDAKHTVTTLTGHRILFVEVWTNLVHRDVEELSGYAFGGNS